MNRSRNGGEQPNENPSSEPAPEAATPARRTRSRRGSGRGAAAAEALSADVEAPVVASEPASDAPTEPDAAAAATPPTRRTRGGRRASGRGTAAATTSDGVEEPPAAAFAVAPPEEPAAQPEPDAEPVLLPSQTQIRTRRGSRGRGGRGRGGRDSAGAAYDAANAAAPAPVQPASAPAARPPVPSRRSEAPSGSLEALIARQNVLFEDFANQQTLALRDVQRAVSSSSGRAGGLATGSTLALPKVAVFLDVPNLIYAAEQMGIRVHFGRLLDYLTEGRQLVRATAYAPITDDPNTRFETQRFVAPVYNHGWKIVSKPWKRFADGSMKANFDIELAVDILTMSDRLDIVILLSGDGDFRRVCELVESKGVRVEVVAFAQSTAMELRAVADSYVDLGSILNLVGA